jgi:hypothetical protein
MIYVESAFINPCSPFIPIVREIFLCHEIDQARRFCCAIRPDDAQDRGAGKQLRRVDVICNKAGDFASSERWFADCP